MSCFARTERNCETGDATAHDDNVGLDRPSWVGGQQSMRQRQAALLSGTQEALPTAKGRLSIKRVDPTVPATIISASPVNSSSISPSVSGSTRAT